MFLARRMVSGYILYLYRNNRKVFNVLCCVVGVLLLLMFGNVIKELNNINAINWKEVFSIKTFSVFGIGGLCYWLKDTK